MSEDRDNSPKLRPAGKNGGPLFTEKIGPNGYVWWYIDALSDDGQYGLTIIAFIGSVFSPYYAWARNRAAPHGASPYDHCAINVALYDGLSNSPSRTGRRHGHRWAMTERTWRHVAASEDTFRVGPSSLHWDGERLTIDIDEISLPFPATLRGRVVVKPIGIWQDSYRLDEAGDHFWRPIAPIASVTVEMDAPRIAWRGTAYVDSNVGTAPLESAFVRWDWSRGKQIPPDTEVKDDAGSPESTFVVYDVHRTDGTNLTLAKTFRVSPTGMATTGDFVSPRHQKLPTTAWGIHRATACDAGTFATVVKTVEDTPFYARSVVRSVINQAPMVAVHESLSLSRFRSRWVQCLLPFKMPRRR
jgi:carotenoid 1,2-hydratase